MSVSGVWFVGFCLILSSSQEFLIIFVYWLLHLNNLIRVVVEKEGVLPDFWGYHLSKTASSQAQVWGFCTIWGIPTGL